MRIARLDLLRYGLFTDRSIALPQGSHDFHLLVGPNEAGKSTVRSAILDTLFGIETRSTYNFLHPHSEMRLGALIEHDGKALEFHRAKGRTRTLFASNGTPLADNALAMYLGSTDRAFFDQMFGLDHEKLIAGGNEILSASNDVGQILFQSASGIGSLGEIRDALEAEANSLWARRKSADRAYYVAAEELAQADAALKQATVRTKDWVTASGAIEILEEQLDISQKKYRDLEERRIRLERTRRVAPSLNTIREKERELTALGEVVVLPPAAGKQLMDAELELAKAGQERTLVEEQADVAQRQLADVRLDENLLRAEVDIQALADTRQQVRNHESDIVKRQLEIGGHWRNIESLIRQLGWPPEDEEQLDRRLPGLPVRTAIADLIKQHGVLEQALSVADQVVRDKDIERGVIEGQIKALPSTSVSPSLRVALSDARGLGDIEALERRLKSQLAKAHRDLDLAASGLGPWKYELNLLRKLYLPSTREIDELQKRQATHEATAIALADRLRDMRSSIRELDLEITQYRDAHAPVTLAELVEVRASRDAGWQAIKSGEIVLAEAAPAYESKVQSADSVSDRRHDKAQEVSELQAKLDSLQRLKQQAEEQELRIAANNAAQLALQNGWAAKVSDIGVPGMSLHATGPWREAREKVLRAADTVADASLALDELTRGAAEAKATLVAALSDGITVDPSATIAALIVAAADAVDAASKARVLQEALEKQRVAATLAKAVSEDKALAARTALGQWNDSWRENLVLAGLNASTSVGTAEGALSLFASIEGKLAAIRELRKERIETMQKDLDSFAFAAQQLTVSAAPDLTGQSPATVASELAARLARAKSDQKEHGRLSRELASLKEKAASASARIDAANAGIQPLLHLAKASTNDELRAAIARSDQWRDLGEAIAAAKKTAQDAGDGLSLEALDTEWQSTDIQDIPVVLGDIDRGKDELLREQNTLSADKANASAALSKIAGQDEAARAESRRQDALAKMGNSAERYIKVFTAGRLLRWAIDRYRETKQGPMLARAGAIFSGLTFGSFKKLVVDFDSEPLTLQGQRAGGALVGIGGMSDGTRDQLYLALRMAALELHLGQAQSLPFIADDLFVNFDDARAKAGLEELKVLSANTQVLFLSHHDHLVPAVREVFGKAINIVRL
jgi:uncharacterized protein YhaN